jgi:hypothetical protein
MKDPQDKDLALRAALRRLPQSVAPSRDLWAGIAQGISAETSRPVSKGHAGAVRWAIAAGIIGLAVGVLLTLSMQRTQPPPSAQNPPQAQPSAITPPPPAASAGYDFVPASTDAVRQKLRADVARQLANLPPATRDKVEKDLLLIKNAVADIQSALANDPGSALLQDLLVTTYQNELDTLANVQALTSSAHSEVSI